MILTKAEQKELNRGPKRTDKVKAHERTIILRSEQSIKDRNFENFAVSILGQFERFGTSAADRRHVVALNKLLKKAIDQQLKLVG